MTPGAQERDAATAIMAQQEGGSGGRTPDLRPPPLVSSAASGTRQKPAAQEGTGPCWCHPCRSVPWAQSWGVRVGQEGSQRQQHIQSFPHPGQRLPAAFYR